MSDSLIDRIQSNLKQREALMEEVLLNTGMTDQDVYKFIHKAIPQSELFMLELIPFLHRLYLDLPEMTVKTVLDIGPQTFSGTALLSKIHHPKSNNRLKLKVSALDIHAKLKGLKDIIAPEIEFIVADLFSLKNRKFDVVIASHVIEHVPNPVAFMRQMQCIANDFVMIAAPWKEAYPLSGSHINVIDEQLVAAVSAEELQVYTNYCWGKGRQVCMFKLPAIR